MNPDALTGQFDLYLAVLETGSFSAAARQLGVATSSVTRLVDSLEQRLAAPLLNRSTRSCSPKSKPSSPP